MQLLKFITMKKIIPILIIIFGLLSCNNDDNYADITLKLERQALGFRGTTPNENGKYTNVFDATFSNPHPKDITGHVRFTIKEYGTFNSESGVVPSAPNTEKTFFLSLETDKIIDESYLIKAEFVRE